MKQKLEVCQRRHFWLSSVFTVNFFCTLEFRFSLKKFCTQFLIFYSHPLTLISPQQQHASPSQVPQEQPLVCCVCGHSSPYENVKKKKRSNWENAEWVKQTKNSEKTGWMNENIDTGPTSLTALMCSGNNTLHMDSKSFTSPNTHLTHRRVLPVITKQSCRQLWIIGRQDKQSIQTSSKWACDPHWDSRTWFRCVKFSIRVTWRLESTPYASPEAGTNATLVKKEGKNWTHTSYDEPLSWPSAPWSGGRCSWVRVGDERCAWSADGAGTSPSTSGCSWCLHALWG